MKSHFEFEDIDANSPIELKFDRRRKLNWPTLYARGQMNMYL